MGGLITTLRNFWPIVAQAYPPKSKFSTDQIPDLTGRVMIVTGENVPYPLHTAPRSLVISGFSSKTHVLPLPFWQVRTRGLATTQ